MNETESLQDEETAEKERRSNFWFYTVIGLLMLAVIGFTVYRNKTYGIVEVSGSSMCQTLQDGQQLVMSKELTKLERGDIIIVSLESYRVSETKHIIKRLIATEGDRVKCEDGQLYLWKSGETGYAPLLEPYAYYADKKETYDFEEYYVGKGEIFFLGDNRFNSMDSRYREENGSHLKNSLYKIEDLVGYIPDWAMEEKNAGWIKLLFFGGSSCAR